MKLQTTKTVLIFSLTLLLVSASAYGYLFWIFNDLFSNITGRYNTNAQGKAMLGELNKVEQNLKDTLANKDRLTALFVKGTAVADFIQVFETMMKKTNLAGSVDSVADEQIGDGADNSKAKLNVAVTASGEWQDVVRFVGLIEKIPYKSTVDSVSLTPTVVAAEITDKQKATSRTLWKVSVKMHVLMIKSKDTQDKTQ